MLVLWTNCSFLYTLIHYRWSPIDCPVPTKPHPHSPSTTSSHITTHTHTHNTNKDPVAAGKEGGRSDTNNQKEFFEFRKLEGGRGGREERQREGEIKEESAISETEKNGTNEGAHSNCTIHDCVCQYTLLCAILQLCVLCHQTKPSQLRVKWRNRR